MTKSSDNQQQKTQNSSYFDTLAKIDLIDKKMVQVLVEGGDQEAREQLQKELLTLESDGKDGLDYRAELENTIKQMETTIIQSNGVVSTGDYDKVAGELRRIYTRDEQNGIDPGLEPEKYERLTAAVDMISRHTSTVNKIIQGLQLEEEIKAMEVEIEQVRPRTGYNIHWGNPDGTYEAGDKAKYDHLTEQLQQKQQSLQKYSGNLSQGELRQTISEMRTPIMIRNPQNSQTDYQIVMEELQKKGGAINTEDFSYPTLITIQQKKSTEHTKQQSVNSLKTKFQAALKSTNPEARDINWKDDACKELIKGFEKIYDINETYPKERDHTRTMDASNTRRVVKTISIAAMATLDVMKQYSVDADKAYDHIHQLLKKSVINSEMKDIISNEIKDIVEVKQVQDSVAATIESIEGLKGKDNGKLIDDMGPKDAEEFIGKINYISSPEIHRPTDNNRGFKEALGVGIAGDVKLNNQSLAFALSQLNNWCEIKLEETNKSVFKKVGQVVSDAANLVNHYVTYGFSKKKSRREELQKKFNDSLQSCLEPKRKVVTKAAALREISENVKTWGDKIKANQVTLDSPQSHSSSPSTRINSSGKADKIGGRG